MRIGTGGLSCECCTFSTLRTTASDFSVVRGESLLGQYGFASRYSGVEFVPLVRARALPGGPIDPLFYNGFKRELLGMLESGGPWDGLFLDMHGAANVPGIEDAEADLFACVRDVVGDDCIVGTSYDLHGNLSPEAATRLDILTAYRTAPHTDRDETVHRACDLVVARARRKSAPGLAYVGVPVLLPGEKTGTGWEPGASLYGEIPSVIERNGLLDASILIGYAWADEARATASVVALGDDPDRALEAARYLARRLWEARDRFAFGTPAAGVDECLKTAMRSSRRPVVVCDSGDNPTAGGAGDVPYVLGRLIALGATGALVAGITDPAAVEMCAQAGTGNKTTLSLGGKLDTDRGEPLRVKCEVLAGHNHPWRHKGEGGGAAVVRTGGVDVIVTERRKPFHTRRDFADVGIDPKRYRIVVVKMGYLVPEIQTIAAAAVLALSPGAVDQNITALPYRKIRRPMYPFDPDMQWTPPERSIV